MFPLGPRLRHSRTNRQAFNSTAITSACPACGREVIIEPRVVGTACPHCRTPLHRQPDDDTPVAATGILPCAVPLDAAKRHLAEALAKALAPGQSLPDVRLVFVPFWRFAAHARASWTERTYDRAADESETRDGGVASDYDEATAAVEPGDDDVLATIARMTPDTLAAAVPFDPALLAGHEAMQATRPVSEAWVAMRERWEARLQAVMRRNAGGWVTPTEVEDTLTEYSNEQAALVYVPVYVPEVTSDPPATPFVIDGVTGEVVLYRAPHAGPRETPELEENPLAGPPVGGIGIAMMFVVASAIWLAWRLWWS